MTMAEIAKLAGVAESTVSRALAGSNRVSQATKDRIFDLVKEKNYKINTRARNLRTQRSNMVEVIIPISPTNRQHFSDPFFSQIISSIADALAENNYDLILSRICPWSDESEANILSDQRADGLIIIGQGSEPERLAHYAQKHKNLIVWGADLPGRTYPVVGSDNFLGGQLAGQHFLDQGRRRIVFLGDVRHSEISLRHQGCLQALTAGDAESDQIVTLSMPFDSASAYKATQALFQGGAVHDAIFAATDVLAIAAIQAISDLGLKVPEDVSVIGYDDIAMAAYAVPALTTIRQDTDAGGRALVEGLLAIFNGDTPQDRILPTEIVIRRSCDVKK